MRAGVHRCNERELRGEAHRTGGATDGYDSVLEWLAQSIERVLTEFRQLVQEENSAVGEAYLSRPRRRASANQPRVADRVVRGAEGPLTCERCVRRQRPLIE